MLLMMILRMLFERRATFTLLILRGFCFYPAATAFAIDFAAEPRLTGFLTAFDERAFASCGEVWRRHGVGGSSVVAEPRRRRCFT